MWKFLDSTLKQPICCETSLFDKIKNGNWKAGITSDDCRYNKNICHIAGLTSISYGSVMSPYDNLPPPMAPPSQYTLKSRFFKNFRTMANPTQSSRYLKTSVPTQFNQRKTESPKQFYQSKSPSDVSSFSRMPVSSPHLPLNDHYTRTSNRRNSYWY